MPETTGSQSETATHKKVNWKKVALTVVFIIIAAGVIIAIYWFLIFDKPKPTTIEPVKVSTPSAKQATPSAQPATPSAKKDETADWVAFSDKVFGYSAKHPPGWKFSHEPGGSGISNDEFTILNTVLESLKEGQSFSDWMKNWTKNTVKNRKIENVTVSGLPALYTYIILENGHAPPGTVQVATYYAKDGLVYMIGASFHKSKESQFLPIYKQFIATLKFLD